MIVKKHRSAFTLIEISLVILIIGIIIAGVTESTNLVSKYKLYMARNQTKSSPVNAVSGLVTWLDATSEFAFENDEDQDGYTVSTWKDINPQSVTKNNATQSTLALKPTYKESCINGLPCINFNSENNQNFDIDLSDLANSNSTIFIVEQRRSGKDEAYIISGEDADVGKNLMIGYKTETRFAAGHDTVLAGYSDPNVPVYTSPTARIYSYMFNSSSDNGMFMYLNGENMNLFSAEDPEPKTVLTEYPSPHIGGSSETGYYEGDICEIIIFNKALRDKDRQAIERYLGKKWGVKITQ